MLHASNAEDNVGRDSPHHWPGSWSSPFVSVWKPFYVPSCWWCCRVKKLQL